MTMERPANICSKLKTFITLLDGKRVAVDLVRLTFPRWTGNPIKNDFGGKPVVMYNDKPMFAELAIRQMMIDAGWSAEWVSGSYYLENWDDVPFSQQKKKPLQDLPLWPLLSRIDRKCRQLFPSYAANSCDGCWDVLAWKGNATIFIESKHKDKITLPQRKWLTAALSPDLKLGLDNFVIVKWK